MSVNILLYAPEYRPNLSNMIRSAEFFGLQRIYIFDKNNLLSPPTNKTTRADMEHMARVWTAGAVDHIQIEIIDQISQFMKDYNGRKLATVIDSRAKQLQQFQFQENDLIVMGPEKNGLPFSMRTLCDEKLTLHSSGNTDCLNVSTMLGIMLYASVMQ